MILQFGKFRHRSMALRDNLFGLSIGFNGVAAKFSVGVRKLVSDLIGGFHSLAHSSHDTLTSGQTVSGLAFGRCLISIRLRVHQFLFSCEVVRVCVGVGVNELHNF